MKKLILLAISFFTVNSFAQIPEDALHYSLYPQLGTARIAAIGGAMGSLGGDITATFVNPAGLGMYKTGEFVYSPGIFINNTRSQFRGTDTRNKKNSFNFGTIGFVYGDASPFKKNTSHAISLAFSKLASFNNTYSYQGLNNYSSGAEQWAEEIHQSNESIENILNDPKYAFTSAPALYTYLVDTFTINGETVIKAQPEFLLEKGNALFQRNTVSAKGGLYELALGFATNFNNKIMVGGSVGVPIMSYNSVTTFEEKDTSSNAHNNFGYFTYQDAFKTSGIGLNLKLGVIYRPQEYLRLGFAVHTPTYMFSLKDTRSTYMQAQTEDYAGLLAVHSEYFTGGTKGENKYAMSTPLKFILSGSYVFRELADVKKQKGFVTADIEFVNHRGSRFYSEKIEPDQDEINYYKALGNVIRREFKGNFNFRAGGEMKFNTLMARLGFGYYGNPYKDKELKARSILLCGGLGYRDKGFFIDFTYVHAFNRDVNFPYRLSDKDNTFAVVKNQRGSILATVGFKF